MHAHSIPADGRNAVITGSRRLAGRQPARQPCCQQLRGARCQASNENSAALVSRRQLGASLALAGETKRRPAGALRSSRNDLVLLVLLSTLWLMPAAAMGVTHHAHGEECVEYKKAPSGLQYCDIREGDGPSPVKGTLIRAHYTGKLASNNNKFDSSYDRGRPLSFKVGMREVISGWDEGILGGDGIPPMKEGGLRKLIIPPEMGYGKRGAGGVIPPDATLLFDVELLPKKSR